MAASTVERTQVFLCYSHEDVDLRDPRNAYSKELSQLLTIYRDRGLAEIWSDEQIHAGAEYLKQISEAITRTRVALLLLSNAFLASQFIQSHELPPLLAAEAAGELTIIPVLFRHCSYKKSGLGHFQAAFPVSKPLKALKPTERDLAWLRIGEAIEQALQRQNPGANNAHAPGRVQQTPTLFDELERMEAAPQADKTQDDTAYAEAYCRKVCDDTLLTKIQVLDMDHPLRLDDIYVRVQVHREKRFQYQADLVEGSTQDPLSILNIRQRYLEGRKCAGLEPGQAVQQHPHCVIVGDPGAGKTTLLKYLALQCASGELAEIAACPLFVSLHDFARKSGGSRDLVAYVLAEWEKFYHLESEQARGFLERQLRAGSMLVLLDALDETMIGEESAGAEQSYQAIHDVVSDLHRAYPRSPMVVTARKAAYHQHAHLVGFDLLEVVDFLPEQIEAFVTNWFQHDPDEERRDMAGGLLARLRDNPRISSLAANPLLLGLVAYTYEENNERLPEKRAELYQRCVETLLRKWDDKRKIRRVHPAIDPYEQERLLPRLAWHFHDRGVRYFSRSELLAQIKEFAEIQGKSTQEERLHVILEEITSDNGLLREQAPGSYGFLHLTLQEYFAARHLTRIARGLELLLERLGHPWWEEVTLLYAGQEDDASELLACLLSPGGNGAAPEDLFSSKLLLAGRCLAAQVQIIHDKQLRAKIPNLLIEKLYGPFSLLKHQVAEVLAEIGRAYPEHEMCQTLLEIIVGYTVEFHQRMKLLAAFDNLPGPQFQQTLLPLLWGQHLESRVYTALIEYLSQRKTRAMCHELQHIITNQQAAASIRAKAVHLLCRVADKPTLQWLLELAASEPGNAIYEDIPFELRDREGEILPLASSYLLRVLADPRSSQSAKLYCIVHLPNLGLAKIQCISILTEIILQENATSMLPVNALACLPQDTHTRTVFRQMLTRPALSLQTRVYMLAYIMRSVETDLPGDFLTMLQDCSLPSAMLQQIIISLRRCEDRSIAPILQHISSRPALEASLKIEALLALIERGEQGALQQLLPFMRNNSDQYIPVYKVTTDAFATSPRVFMEQRSANLDVPPDWNIASILARNLNRQSLVELCSDEHIYHPIRVNLAYEIADLADEHFVEPFVALVVRPTLMQGVRLAYIDAIGQLAANEQTVMALLALYQEEQAASLRDALYTALYKIARRANVTVIPSGPGGSVLRVVRR